MSVLATADPAAALETAELVAVARATLERVSRERPLAHPPPAGGPVRVNVTLRFEGRLQASMSGEGPDRRRAVERAAARAALDERFAPRLAPHQLGGTQIELWIQTASEPIQAPGQLDVGIDGVELRVESQYAYFKPSVALTSALHDRRLLDKLARKAGLPADAWSAPSARLRRTSWRHYCELADGTVLELRRLRPIDPPPPTQAAIELAAALAARRLAAVQDRSGYYLYRYHPFTERATEGPVNLVRQAGCAYALARAAATGITDATAASASATARALLARTTVSDGQLFIGELDDPRRGKVGTTALTLAAIQAAPLAGEFAQARELLLAALLDAQRPDGSFRCSNDSGSAAADGSSQDYFPGEALMALATDGSSAALRAMERALPWYQRRFRTQPTTAFVLWQLDAWRQLAALEGPGQAAEFVFELADWLLPGQRDDAAADGDSLGGFGSVPGASTATYTEALIYAFGLAELLHDERRRERYRAAALLGLRFVCRLQIDPRTEVLFPNPAAAIGATTASLSNFTIRCDHDQHALTAYIAALQHPGLFTT